MLLDRALGTMDIACLSASRLVAARRLALCILNDTGAPRVPKPDGAGTIDPGRVSFGNWEMPTKAAFPPVQVHFEFPEQTELPPPLIQLYEIPVRSKS